MNQDGTKVVVVTGAGRGIGRSIAARFGGPGVVVVVHYNKSAEGAEQVAEEIRRKGGESLVLRGDVQDPADVERMFSEVRERVGVPTVLVNNAGVARDKAFLRLGQEEWSTVMRTNVDGTYHCIKAVAFDMMKRKQGRIINISSLSSSFGAPGQANYAASKAAILGLTRCLAAEFGPANVTVNAVIPGLVPSDMTAGIPEERFRSLSARVPLRRLGTGEDIAAVVEFLATEAAAYVTGQVIVVDGGLSCTLA